MSDKDKEHILVPDGQVRQVVLEGTGVRPASWAWLGACLHSWTPAARRQEEPTAGQPLQLRDAGRLWLQQASWALDSHSFQSSLIEKKKKKESSSSVPEEEADAARQNHTPRLAG